MIRADARAARALGGGARRRGVAAARALVPRARRIRVEGFDEVYRVACGDTVAFVVLHAVIRGVAFGGVRIRPYDSEAHALEDALQLARTMSRKVVMAGIRAGGAKTVVVAPPRERAAAVRAVGEFIESLAGRYLCGDDLGFSHDDGVVLRQATRYVACSGLAGQTARGVLIAMNAVCVPRVVVIQGLGAVGRPLAEALEAAGARVTVSDVRAIQGFRTVSPDDVYDEPCDVFVPCATGGLLDARTVPRLRCQIGRAHV